ncbi:MAG TPA: hypothetical protein VJS12_25065 [Steroidobacteraceae bacterium]|nr:hypothetical protein [Steroidobacteraceae bacterium]
MSTRSARLSAVGILLCMLLPLISMAADAPAKTPTRLESLLAAHDVRYAIQAPRASSSECVHSEAERGR